MSLKVILTLVVAFVIVCFGLFNNEFVSINLLGLKTANLPLSFFVFFVFMVGAVFSAILSIQKQIEQSLTIRKLKRRVQEYKDLLEEQDANKQANSRENSSGTVVETYEQPEASIPVKPRKSITYSFQRRPKEETPFALPERRENPLPVFEKRTKNVLQEQQANSEELDIENLSANEDDEAGLSAKLKEIAIRKIQNG